MYLSYLPLAHIFGRVVEEIFLYSGARIGYWQGIPEKLLDDAAALQPTIFCGCAIILACITANSLLLLSNPVLSLPYILLKPYHFFVPFALTVVSSVHNTLT